MKNRILLTVLSLMVMTACNNQQEMGDTTGQMPVSADVSGMISQAKGEYAYSILDIDKVPTEDDINALLAIDGVIKVRAI